MKAVLISIQPKWVEKICNEIGNVDGPIYEKSVEIRKTRPKIDTPFKCCIYCTKSNEYLLDKDRSGMFCWDKKAHHYPFKYEKDFYGVFNAKVIGEFICDSIEQVLCLPHLFKEKLSRICRDSCLTESEIEKYLGYDNQGKPNIGYAWHISNLKIYDKPKELSEFTIRKLVYNGLCGKVYKPIQITKPPQSWCYVEEENYEVCRKI